MRFRAAATWEELRTLRSVERLHVFLDEAELPIETPEAARRALRERLEAIDLGAYLEVLAGGVDLPDAPRFRITARREGEHPFESNDLAGWAGQVVVDRFGWPVDLETFDVEIFLRLEGERIWIAGRLPGDSLRKRAWHTRNHPAALNPVLGYAMVRLADPRPGQRILDPFVGGGTLPIEGALHEPGALWLGSDKGYGALEMASANALAAGVRLPLVQADARRLWARGRSIDFVLGNLPFGRRSGSHGCNRKLYGPFLRETARVLRPGGRALLLTLERRLMEELLDGGPLEEEDRRVVSQSGLHPRIWFLRPR